MLMPLRVPLGQPFDCECWIENRGVAPLYHRYEFALRFSQKERVSIHRSSADPRDWLPGDTWLQESVCLPDGFELGDIRVHAGLVRMGTDDAVITFASEGTDSDGWLPLDRIELGQREA